MGGFLSVTLLLIIVAAGNYIQVTNMENDLQEMVEVQLQLFTLNEELAFNLATRSSHVNAYLLTGQKTYLEEFDKLCDSAYQLEEQLLSMSELEEDAKFVERSRNWRWMIQGYVVSTYDRGEYEEAIKLATSMMAPEGSALIDMAKGRAEISKEQMENLANGIMDLQTRLKTISLVSTGISVILSMVLGTIVAGSITKPVNKLLQVVDKIANGDLRENISIKSNDEIGKLGQAVNKMVENLNELIKETSMASEQVAASSQELMASSEETAAASEQIANSIQLIASGAEHQESTVFNTISNVKEMVSGLQQVAVNIQVVKESSKQASSSSQEGTIAVSNVTNQIATILWLYIKLYHLPISQSIIKLSIASSISLGKY